MATNTTPDVTEAYATVFAAEKQAVQDLDALCKAFTDGVAEIASRFPTDTPLTPLRTNLGAMAAPFYQLAELKQRYGLMPVANMSTAVSGATVATPIVGGSTNG